jgi:hypothetical protein
MSKTDSNIYIVDINNESLRIAIDFLPISDVNLSAIESILKEEIEKRTQDSPDPIVREKNAKELVRLFDAVFEKMKEIKWELTRVSLENKNLNEVLSKKNNDSAKKNNLPL